MWPILVKAKSLESILKDKSLINDTFQCTSECIEVCAKRGVDIGKFPEINDFTKVSGLRAFFMRNVFKFILKHSEYHRRCMAHSLDDPKEIKFFYDNVLLTGKELGLEMPCYSKYQNDIEFFYLQLKQ